MSNIDKLTERINSCENGYYLRFDESKNANISIGKTETGEYSFVVEGKTQRSNFNSSDKVNLYLHKSENQDALFFTLKDNDSLDLFLNLVNDIFDSVSDSSSNLIELAYRRWRLWGKLFSSDILLLSSKSIQGLLAELFFINDHLSKLYTVDECILSWGGSDYYRKDFEIFNEWYEIKSITTGNDSLYISSLEQLESKYEGYIVICSVSKTTQTNINGINLNKLVQTVSNRIEADAVYEIFIKKLENLDYAYNDAYNESNYVIDSVDYFLINDDFPKLTKNNVPVEITRCDYEINIPSINRFKVKR